MLSSLSKRIGLYVVMLIAGTVTILVVQIQESNANMADDPSSRAWMAFLPYLIPIFMAHSAAFVVPFAVVVEAVLAAWRYFR